MKRLIIGSAIFSALLLGMSGIASADHAQYRGRGHYGYSYRAPVSNYWHNHYSGGRYGRCHFYGGRHHFSVGYAAPVYVAPVYPNYWHNHYYRGRNNRCHYYGDQHHYGRDYRPRSHFNFGISIFR